MSILLQGMQSVLNPRGPDAEDLADLSWVLFIGATAIFILVAAVTCYALLAPRDRTRRLSTRWLIVGGGVLFPGVVLTTLLGYIVMHTAAMSSPTESP